MVRVFGWLLLLGRSQAFREAEGMVVRDLNPEPAD
jgi:hypothetical protein